MSLVRPAADAEPARWLLEARADWWDLVRFGPRGFEAYVRISFDAAGGDEVARRTALTVLAGHTSTPSAAYAAIWAGWTGSRPAPEAPRVDIPNRPMLLFTGPVQVLADAPALAWHGVVLESCVGPHLVWPQDRAWCVACEVDEELELTVGCSRVAAGALADAMPSAVRPAAYGEAAPLYRDHG